MSKFEVTRENCSFFGKCMKLENLSNDVKEKKQTLLGNLKITY